MWRLIAIALLGAVLAGCANADGAPVVTGAMAEKIAPGEISNAETLAFAKANPGKPASAPIMARVKQAAMKKLRDGMSAHWTDAIQATRLNVKGERIEVVCGQVNAKNAFGAYVGFRPFVFMEATNDFHSLGGDDFNNMLSGMIIRRFCPPIT